MAGTPEGRVKKDVKLWLKVQGIWYFCPVQMGIGVVGIPDFICCEPVLITPEMVGTTVGRFLAIETKAPGQMGAMTPNQIARFEEIAKAHGKAVLTDSVQRLDELKESKKWLHVNGVTHSGKKQAGE